MRVTVFGGSAPKPGDVAYQNSLNLGRILGSAGCTVLTGGYIGTMEAVSRGAAENGGHVIGVTCDQIEKWRPVKPNKWIHEEIRCDSITQRITTLVEKCDSAIALPGGVGTLNEITMMWTCLITRSIPLRPLILTGSEWETLIQSFFSLQNKYIPDSQQQWLAFAENIEDAVKILAI